VVLDAGFPFFREGGDAVADSEKGAGKVGDAVGVAVSGGGVEEHRLWVIGKKRLSQL